MPSRSSKRSTGSQFPLQPITFSISTGASIINDWLIFAQRRLFYDLIAIYGSPEWRTLWQERALGDLYAWLCVLLGVTIIIFLLAAAKVTGKEVAKVAQQVMTYVSLALLGDALLPGIVPVLLGYAFYRIVRHFWQQHRCQQAQQARA